MGNRRLGRKRLESVLKQLNATDADTTGSRSGLKGFDMPAYLLQPAKYFGFFDDFLAVNGNIAIAADGDMAQATAINQGVWRTNVDGTSDTITLDNSYTGGVLEILGGTTDNEETHMTAIDVGFALDASTSRKLWFECRIQNSDVDLTGWFIGLASDNGDEETSILTDGGGATEDAIGFYNIAGDVTEDINFLTAKQDSETVTNTGADIVDDTWVNLAFYWDGSSAHTYVNGSLKNSVTSTVPNDGTILLPAIHFAQRVGSAADTFRVDYINICMER